MCYICLVVVILFFFFFKQKTAYEMRISDWSSDVCSSDLTNRVARDRIAETRREFLGHRGAADDVARLDDAHLQPGFREIEGADEAVVAGADNQRVIGFGHRNSFASGDWRSEAHTSELQSLMRIPTAVFFL